MVGTRAKHCYWNRYLYLSELVSRYWLLLYLRERCDKWEMSPGFPKMTPADRANWTKHFKRVESTCLRCGYLHDSKARWCPNCGVHQGTHLTRADKMMPGCKPTRCSYAAGNRWYKTPVFARMAELDPKRQGCWK
jgi:hypothetical protein